VIGTKCLQGYKFNFIFKLKIKDFRAIGGTGIISRYKWSNYQMLSTLYPKFEWLPWRFDKCPNNYWENLKNQRQFIEWAGKELGVKDMNDWYKVTHKVADEKFSS
jgi:hypothetical protein